MNDSGASRWRALPTALASEELASWCPRIPAVVGVTGGTGFIGSHLVEALRRAGVHLRLLVRDPAKLPNNSPGALEVVVGDIGDRAALAALVSGCGGVVHAAGLVRSGLPQAFDRANRGGTENLVRALAGAAPEARLVHVSSLAAAGPSRDPRGIGPEATPRPVSAYGRSKLAGEAAVRTHRGPWLILRPPTTFGPRETDVLQFFRLARLGLVPIPAGERFVTVVHVSDVVRAILSGLAGAVDNRILHIGDPTPGTLRDMVAMLAQSGGLRARTVAVPPLLVRAVGLGGDALQWLGLRGVAMTSDKARELLARHWTARTEDSLAALGLGGTVPLRAGFAATWTWYRESGWVPHAKIRPRNEQHSERG
jgi:nucleoside-diphosphate-sugar epimerase